ncbi:MAG: hypothetical protein AB1714_20165 [Acidobacteriota bacterium]
MKKRGEGDFAAQLAAYGDLGRLWRQQGAAARAAENFEKAIQVAVHLERSDEMYSLYESLISAHQDAGDMDGVLDDYTMLFAARSSWFAGARSPQEPGAGGKGTGTPVGGTRPR